MGGGIAADEDYRKAGANPPRGKALGAPRKARAQFLSQSLAIKKGCCHKNFQRSIAKTQGQAKSTAFGLSHWGAMLGDGL